MRRRILSKTAIRHAAIALVLVVSLVFIGTPPVAAIELEDYFEISYDFELSQDVVYDDEVFYANVTGEATCITDIPIVVSEAQITFRIVAEAGGDPVILNAGYTVTIKPFPNNVTDPPIEIDENIPLHFPDVSASGIYYVVAELVEAKVYGPLFPGGFDVTTFLPPSQAIDTVTYNPPYQPSSPSPANHATGVSINADLSWTGGDPDAGDTVTYDVYFGTGATPPFKETTGPYPAAQSPITYDPGTLSYNTEYHWKIIAEDNHGASTTGAVWDFTTRAPNNPPDTPSVPSGPGSGYTGTSYSYSTSATDPDGDQVKYTFDWEDGTSETGLVDSGTTASKSHTWSSPGTYYVTAKATDSEDASSGWSDSKEVTISIPPNNPPNTPGNPSPANHATGVSIYTDLGWAGGDPDAGDTVTYDVYFGTGATPPLVSGGQTGTTYNPGTLSYNTKYYWKITAEDNHTESTTGPVWDFTTGSPSNNPPNKPSRPSGPGSGDTGTSYSYSTSATDPDGDQVKYTFDWRDGSTSQTGFVNSGTTANESHTWSSPGTYYIKAKATDSEGASSGWSISRKVTISAAPNNPPNQPGNPSPANHATGVPVNADLGWTGGDPDAGDTVTYDVYFGTSATPPLVSEDQTGTTYDPGTLSYNTKYYWKITAGDNHAASTTGPVWDFTTAGEWVPWAYDENSDGIIQKTEAIQAVMDYFSYKITKAQAIGVIMLYFG